MAYLLPALPFAVDLFKTCECPPSVFRLAVDAVLGGAILIVILVLRQARMRAQRVDSLRKTLNQAIIHDLKNPMTSIMGCLSCVLHDAPGVAEQRKLLRLAEHSCRAQMALLETLVDTSRIEEGELKARKEPVTVPGFLDGILDDARGTAAHLGIILKETIAEGLPARLHADAELLRRVLSNLIHNSLKYTPAGGTVSLAIGFDPGRFHFEVSDTGIGIAAAHLERLFDKYYRVEGSDQSSRRGSGLGLYFCRLAVEAHGGDIRVSSEVGRGTTIAFDIPETVTEERRT